MRRVSGIIAAVVLCASIAAAQRPEVTIHLNEAFFESLLDALFQNGSPLEIAIAENKSPTPDRQMAGSANFARRPDTVCREVIQLLRESGGIRTAVKFRNGKITAPLAFTGNYNPPLIGCVPFSGIAETVIELEFDQQNQRMIARARVLNVSLNGTGGVGGTLIARMVQGSIDRKINPIEVFTMDRISFLLPIRKDTNLRMKASAVRHEIVNGGLNIMITYDFIKA